MKYAAYIICGAIFLMLLTVFAFAATDPKKPVDNPHSFKYTMQVLCPTGEVGGVQSDNPQDIVETIKVWVGQLTAREFLLSAYKTHPQNMQGSLDFLRKCMGTNED